MHCYYLPEDGTALRVLLKYYSDKIPASDLSPSADKRIPPADFYLALDKISQNNGNRHKHRNRDLPNTQYSAESDELLPLTDENDIASKSEIKRLPPAHFYLYDKRLASGRGSDDDVTDSTAHGDHQSGSQPGKRIPPAHFYLQEDKRIPHPHFYLSDKRSESDVGQGRGEGQASEDKRIPHAHFYLSGDKRIPPAHFYLDDKRIPPAHFYLDDKRMPPSHLYLNDKRIPPAHFYLDDKRADKRIPPDLRSSERRVANGDGEAVKMAENIARAAALSQLEEGNSNQVAKTKRTITKRHSQAQSPLKAATTEESQKPGDRRVMRILRSVRSPKKRIPPAHLYLQDVDFAQ